LIRNYSEDAPFNGKHCTLANPHSNAVVDLDGDCLAGNAHWFPSLYSCTEPVLDVFLVCDDGRGGKSYQIWVNAKDDGFSLSQEGALPSGTQTISFADIGMFCLIASNVH